VVVLALAFAIASPAVADTRGRAKPPTRAKQATKAPAKPKPKAKATRSAAPKRPPARTAVKKKSEARPAAAAMVMVHGALRAARDPHRRSTSALTREEAAAEALEKILRGPLRFGTTGIYVVDAETGRELFAVHPDDPLNPASNVKLISTATALDLLGPDFRYRTRVLGATPDDHGVVPGDVYLFGSYDPTLSRGAIGDLAAAVAAGGVTRIAGDVIVGSTPTRDGIYRASVRVDVVAGAPGEAPAVSVTPAYDFVEVVTTATSGKRARVKGRLAIGSKLVTRDDGRVRLVITVAGAIGKGKRSSRWISTKERHRHTAHILRAALRTRGVELTGDVAVKEFGDYVDGEAALGRLPVTLAEHRSDTLGNIVKQVNKRSINWLSDRVLATATALTREEKPSMDDGIDAMYGWLDRAAGIPRDKLVVDTGSGLSYRTQFSPRQIVSVVRAASGLDVRDGIEPEHAQACAEAWKTSLSVGGVDGTLRRRFRTSGLRGRVHGKTGTLSTVIALSGLLEGTEGRTLAFAVVTNGHSPGRKNLIRGAHEQVLEVLDDYLAGLRTDVAETAAQADAAAAAAAAASASESESGTGSENEAAEAGAPDDGLSGDDDEPGDDD
jgi:D-alanyl-D-alanine carboxypeptidase/D-alanyl-D-alanine-endopeptidase (penicillin-binding protein 4)